MVVSAGSTTAEIEQNYWNLFGRQGNSVEIRDWWRSGLTGTQLTEAMRSSAEKTDKPYMTSAEEVKQNFRNLFGREPAQEGLKYWVDSGFTGAQLTEAIRRGAGEADKRYMANNTPGTSTSGIPGKAVTTAAEIQQNYSNLFGPNASASDKGVDYWINTGFTGTELTNAIRKYAEESNIEIKPPTAEVPLTTRTQQSGQSVMTNALANKLYTDEIRQNFLTLFGREPAQEGLDYWRASGFRADQLTEAIRRGATGRDREILDSGIPPTPGTSPTLGTPPTPGIDTTNEVIKNFQDLFGRDPLKEGLDYWVNSGFTGQQLTEAIRKGATGEDVVTLKSAEISRIFMSLFGREPTQEGLDYWGQSGLTGDALLQAIYRGAQEEDTARYSDRTEEYQNLYFSLFGKKASNADILRWMDSGLTGDDLIRAMLEGAQGTELPAIGGVEGFDLEGYTQAFQDYVGSQETIAGLMEGPGEFKESPGYQFRLEEGEKAIERSAAARGGLLSGATTKALTRYGQDYATADYDNFLRRYYDSLKPWQSMAGIGQTSATGAAGQAGAFGANIGQTMLSAGNTAAQNAIAAGQATAAGAQNIGQATAAGAYQTGQAQAGGAINQANVITGALGSGINNYLMWKYMNPST